MEVLLVKDSIIKRVINNNVVLVEEKGQHFILVGKGIGFGRKKEEIFTNLDNIEEKFISLKGLDENEFDSFLTRVDFSVLELVQDIIRTTKDELGYELNPKTHVGLIDHMNFAIKRLEDGIVITNPFLYETKFLYPNEYKLAEKAIAIFEKKLNIKIPEAEAGFIALHLYGGRKNKSKKEALNVSKMLNSILIYVEKKLNTEIDRDSFECARFLMHLKSVLNRLDKNKCLEDFFVPNVKEKLSVEYKVAYDISKIVERTLKVSLPESELGYIALHLHKLRTRGFNR